MWKKWKQSAAWRLAALFICAMVLSAGCGGSSGGADNWSGRSQAEGQSVQQESREEQKGQEKQESQREQQDQEKQESQEEQQDQRKQESQEEQTGELSVQEDGEYILKDEVALYLHIYGKLPGNFVTKKEAQELGWDNKKGNLDEVAPGKSIGGSYFGNYERLLPKKKGRKYYECDLEYEGGYRGAKRLIYSNDGLIFYTEDHYKTFEQLY